MKRILCVTILVMALLCGCIPQKSDEKNSRITPKDKKYVCGVWISYSEINTMLMTGNFASNFDDALENCEQKGITDIFVHVRAFCNSIYKSEYFPMLDIAENYDYDILEYTVNSSHNRGIRVHAWINPYRVRTSDNDIEKISTDSPAYIWLNDDDVSNDENVCITEEGIYLNPASFDVRQLIINGIREILLNYSVDGIHFDDYFYPTVDVTFDSSSYKSYCESCTHPLSLDDWRRTNVNALISGSFTAVKFIDKDIIFSVSPAASIEKNYASLYADVSAWLESECVDWIIPQIYFGFEYPDENYRFKKLLDDWKGLSTYKSCRLILGLAAYKIETDTAADRDEWANGKELILEEMKVCDEDESVSGHIFFSLTSFLEKL